MDPIQHAMPGLKDKLYWKTLEGMEAEGLFVSL